MSSAYTRALRPEHDEATRKLNLFLLKHKLDNEISVQRYPGYQVQLVAAGAVRY